MSDNSDRVKLVEPGKVTDADAFKRIQERLAQATRSLERSGVPPCTTDFGRPAGKTESAVPAGSADAKDVGSASTRDGSQEWVDRGVLDVPVADLPNPDGIEGSTDFHKLSAPEMKAGLARLEEMKPAIASGKGASSDYWAEHDRQHGLDYAHGYQRVYEAFYGNDAIRLTNDGKQYDIVNGRHRVWLAKRMDVKDLPARVIERR